MIPWKDAGFRALGWWRALQPAPEANRPGDRAALARLRRCSTVSEAMLETSALLLFQAVEATVANDLPTVALAAAVLAHVRNDRLDTSVARLIGPGSIETPETALLKPLRFRRLMEAGSLDERLAAFRRLAALVPLHRGFDRLRWATPILHQSPRSWRYRGKRAPAWLGPFGW